MTTLGPELHPSEPPGFDAPSGSRKRKPPRMLAVVDGTERSNRIVDYIVTVACAQDVEVVVLNVQDKRDEARLRGYQSFKQSEIDDRLINELGAPIVASVAGRLDKAGIRTRSHVMIGNAVPAILRCAADEACDVIVVGAPPAGPLQRWLARETGLTVSLSLAAQLVVLASAPVIVVK